MSRIKKAERKNILLRMALTGPSGSGKTWTALDLATRIGKNFDLKVGVIDTERGSASKYAEKFGFDVIELVPPFSPDEYIRAMDEFVDGKYQVLVIDSTSHAWAGEGGVLEIVDNRAKQMKTANTYAAWRDGTKAQNVFVNALVSFPGHLIVTMRSKMAYVQERDAKKGRTVINKVGMEPVQRDGMEYEFDIVGDMDLDHNLVVSKTRNDAIADKVFPRPGAGFASEVCSWVSDPADVEMPTGDLPPAEDMVKLLTRVVAGEEHCLKIGAFKLAKHRDNARAKVLGRDGKPDIIDGPDKLNGYLTYLLDKVAEHKKAEATKEEAA